MVSSTLPVVYKLFLGVEIAATTATIAIQAPGHPNSKAFTIDQTLLGFAALQQRLLKTGCTPEQILVVLEATVFEHGARDGPIEQRDTNPHGGTPGCDMICNDLLRGVQMAWMDFPTHTGRLEERCQGRRRRLRAQRRP
ncbi:MAG: hypothetical protein NVS2B7_30440 [Herpetosiphon sp.]